jgi:predicted TIM-barrel fold metal-dependent hydrolase
VNGVKKHGYRFIGELLYTHGDKRSGKQYLQGERYVDPSLAGTTRLLEAIAPFDIPFMAHWEPYAPKRDYPKFHALYSAWPNQTFLLPHMGFASPETVGNFMDRHPNLYLLTSKKERYMGNYSDPDKQAAIGSAMLEGQRLRPEWKKLLIKYQDRILFATDPHMAKLWDRYDKVVNNHRLILGQLPRKVAEKIAYKNAEKMYGVYIEDK